MTEGYVVSIHVAPDRGARTAPVREARAVTGMGLEGDRHFGRADRDGRPDRELTLIEAEAVEALAREYGVTIDPGDARRNLVTRGVALNHLVDREFTVGEVSLRGIKLCEPCAHLASLTDEKVLRGLVHRGGLRAQIIAGGTIRVGDAVDLSA